MTKISKSAAIRKARETFVMVPQGGQWLISYPWDLTDERSPLTETHPASFWEARSARAHFVASYALELMGYRSGDEDWGAGIDTSYSYDGSIEEIVDAYIDRHGSPEGAPA